MLDGAIHEEVTKPPTPLQVVEWCCNSDGNVYHLVVDNDVNIDYDDVVEAEEVL